MKSYNIAVIIPTYMPGNYFKKCINSLKKQTIKENSFIIYICLNGVKNHYEDFILYIMNESGLTFRYFYCQNNGVSNARNLLLANSSEDYIVFVDDDDIVSDNYLEELLKVTFEDCMGISNIYNFKKNIEKTTENYIGKTFNDLKSVETSKYKSRKYFSSPCAKMIHRKMIQEYKFNNKLYKGEDSVFMAEISKNIFSVKKVENNASYFVYERIGSLTRNKTKRMDNYINWCLEFKLYYKLLFNKKYNTVFIITRILAVVKKIITNK